MDEKDLKLAFEQWLTVSGKQFHREFPINGGRIDFVIDEEEKVCGVEIKGARANIYSTIGQLINALRTFSHLYLLAPIPLIEKIDQVLHGTGFQETIGYMTMEKNGFVYIKKASSPSYYFNSKIKIEKTPQPKIMIVSDADMQILETFKQEPLTIASVSKLLNISMTHAHKRVSRLKKAKLIEEINTGGYPKAFKVVKTSKPEEIISLGT